MTFRKRLEANPSYGKRPGEINWVVDEEGIYIGYWHYEKKGMAPLFPLGHGLTNTTFLCGTTAIDTSALSETDSIAVFVCITMAGIVVPLMRLFEVT